MPPAAGKRRFPRLPIDGAQARRPISFVVVRFSDDYQHNFLRSECVHAALNEVVEVDNRGNLQFDNLTAAIAHGVRRARHELVAVIHEDVLLVPGWQSRFERSLAALEGVDPRWGLVGSVGFDGNDEACGHWSDPHRYQDDFAGQDRPFREVERLDEQLLVLHRDRMPDFDQQQPGIHLVGRHLALAFRGKGYRTWAIDAPTIHKFADQDGRPIQAPGESAKITDRRSLTYRADMQACLDYFNRKWPQHRRPDVIEPATWPVPSPDGLAERIEAPFIVLARGGSGSRLASLLAQDAGVLMGNRLNASGDTLEMVLPIYQGVIEKFQCRAGWQRAQVVPRLRAAAARMVGDQPPDRPWGFKLPESLLLLPELLAAFPRARFLHLVRDPLTTCLRRSHMTARLDNHIGRIALRVAYDTLGRERHLALGDDSAVRMACTTLHQLDEVAALVATLEPGRVLELRFEDLLRDPAQALQQLCAWLGLAPCGHRLAEAVDPQRAGSPAATFTAQTVGQVQDLLAPLRARLGYSG